MKISKTLAYSSILLAHLALAETALKTDNVVISATGFEQDADSNLRNVIVISGKDLEDKGYTSVEEALSRQAGVQFNRTGNFTNKSTNVDMRGQGNRANAAVKVMIDGVTLNVLDQEKLHAAGVTISPLDSVAIEDIERIEIIPGGGAVLYGNGTRGGAINIITKKNKTPQASISFKEQIFDSGNASSHLNLNFSNQISQNLAFSANISGFGGEGYRDGDKDNGFYAKTKLYVDIDDRQSLNFGFGYFKDSAKSTDSITKAQAEDNPKQRGSTNNSYNITRPEFNTEYKVSLSDIWDINAQAFWQKQQVDIAEGDTGFFSSGNFEDSVQGISLKSKIDYMQNSYFVFGYNFERHKSVTFSNSFSNVWADDRKDTHSIFALDSHQFNDFFALSGGARYEYAKYDQSSRSVTSVGVQSYRSVFDTNSNNFALELTPSFAYSDTGRFYAKYERGYISPTPYQFRQSRRVNNVTQYSMNDNLKSETYDTYELGMSDYLFGFYGLDVALYYTQSKDEITSRSSGSNFHLSQNGFGFYNLDKTIRYGVDINARQDFDGFSFYENFSYVDARISGGDLDKKRIPFVSAYKVSVGADYEIISDLRVFADLIYASKAREDQNNQYWIKEHFVTDIGATYTYEKLSIFAGVKNLFDYKYYLSQSTSTNQTTGVTTTSVLPADGRNYYVEFKYKF
ncbi:TonB-dependent receptor [Campylobacter sp. MIT 12-5580]|uniref:TonB-dependent receptor n=1 Tax=Campylobacter sp. MIT 12-5580 TaxID=2040651 RepID=UPI0010F504EF|nr:TonB-dependent receptor [Campylobacter sp. MIT 12-5580]TKX29330.1 TonB-dependent receptor [Campylobacter sp. MIT 12-5580]